MWTLLKKEDNPPKQKTGPRHKYPLDEMRQEFLSKCWEYVKEVDHYALKYRGKVVRYMFARTKSEMKNDMDIEYSPTDICYRSILEQNRKEKFVYDETVMVLRDGTEFFRLKHPPVTVDVGDFFAVRGMVVCQNVLDVAGLPVNRVVE